MSTHPHPRKYPEKVDFDPRKPPKIKTYKYVDLAHAGDVKAGSLKLNTLGGYAHLEDESRRDDKEGMSIHKINYMNIEPGDEDGRKAAAKLLFDLGTDVSGTFLRCEATLRTPPAYCLCLSEVPDSRSLLSSGSQAIFEISDTLGLAVKLQEKYPNRFMSVFVGQVQYSGRVFEDYENANHVPPWMWKEPRDEEDAEVRMIFFAPEGGTAEESICPRDEEIARFLKPFKEAP